MPSFKNIEALVDGIGQIAIGKVDRIPCAAIASDDENTLAMLRARPGETLLELMARLDAAIASAWEREVFIDEINNPPPKGR